MTTFEERASFLRKIVENESVETLQEVLDIIAWFDETPEGETVQ